MVNKLYKEVRDQIRIVSEELDFLTHEWKPDMPDQSIRRGSSSLRLLLIYNELYKAWRNVGFSHQPRILAHTIDDIEEFFRNDKIDFIQAGGALSFGMAIASTAMISRTLTDEEINFLYKRGACSSKLLKLDNYLKSSCMIINNIKISRETLIKYVCNKAGGAHIDSSRSIESNKIDQKFILLDKCREKISVTGRDPCHFELLSLVDSLRKSPDIIKLNQRIKKIIKVYDRIL